jgi:preprotein translocase subunit SecE
MEMKRTQTTSEPETVVSNTKAAADFVGDLKTEIGKINWTSKEELISYTKIVVGATFVFGIGIYFVDLMIQTVFHGLNYLIRLISG